MSQELTKSRVSLATRMGLPVRRSSDNLGELITAFESETVAVFVRTQPVHERITLYVLAGIIVLSLSLASIVTLERVVTSAEGWVMTTGSLLYVSPYDLGIVKEVHVKIGDVVKKGQSLASLDPTFTQANLLQLQEHMSSDVAQIAREKAELVRQPYVYDKSDHYQAIQADLWHQRQGEFNSTVDNYVGQIKSVEAQLSQAKSDAEKYTLRLKIADDVDDIYKPLVDKGYASNLQLLQSTDARTEINRLLHDALNQIPQYAETAASLRAQMDAYIKTFDAATSTQLVADENDRDSTQNNLDQAQKMQDLTSLDAPEDAIVTKIGEVSKGSVQSGAQGTTSNLQSDPLFTLTPLNSPIETELDISTMDVGFIRVGDPVTMKVDAFPFVRFGVVRGKIKSISEASYSVDQNGVTVQPYFKVRVSVEKYLLRNVPKDYRLMPGMTLTGDILVGQRSILSYMLEGIERTGMEAMREP
jgi:hemolysin D